MIRIGMIGCGGIARHHLGQLARIEGVQVVALQDPDAEQIKHCQASFPHAARPRRVRPVTISWCWACRSRSTGHLACANFSTQ